MSPTRIDELRERLNAADFEVDAVDADGKSVLHCAVDLGAYDVVKLVLGSGALVDLRDRWGNTPLWRAVYCCPSATPITELLLQRGADPAATNNHGVSPMDLAQKMVDNTDGAGSLLSVFENAQPASAQEQ